jgi:hypothetical protein
MKIGNLELRVPKPAPISSAPRSRKIALAAVACVALLFLAKPMALLLWARIRILTSLPKTAIAEPIESKAAKPAAPTEIDPSLPTSLADGRDPFQIDRLVFPEPKVADPTAPDANAAGTPAHDPADPAEATDPQHVGESAPKDHVEGDGDSGEPAAYAAMRIAAESVVVRSAGAGLQAAVIDDKAVRVGETVKTSAGFEFTLVAVLDGGVVLGLEGREFVVRMPALAENPPMRPSPKSGGGKP